jgi:hypothetical protein
MTASLSLSRARQGLTSCRRLIGDGRQWRAEPGDDSCAPAGIVTDNGALGIRWAAIDLLVSPGGATARATGFSANSRSKRRRGDMTPPVTSPFRGFRHRAKHKASCIAENKFHDTNSRRQDSFVGRMRQRDYGSTTKSKCVLSLSTVASNGVVAGSAYRSGTAEVCSR